MTSNAKEKIRLSLKDNYISRGSGMLVNGSMFGESSQGQDKAM